MIFERTFHPDEANQAFTVGRLLETGLYTYKPTDHHGPTLYYAAAPLQKAFGHTTTAELDGTLLRCTPLLFAVIGLVFLFLAVVKILRAAGTGPVRSALTALVPVLLVGSSPMFVFYATDFIQEMLLVAFTLMMFWAGTGYCLGGGKLKPGTWALLFGIGAGLAFATKETCVLTFAAMALAAAPFLYSHIRNKMDWGTVPKLINDVILAGCGFFLTAIILYSSFCQDWSGVYNAFIAAPLNYLGRAAGDAAVSEGADWHVHPWWKHLQWLFLGGPLIPKPGGFTPKTHAFVNLLTLIHWLCLMLPVGIFLTLKKKSDPILKVFWGLSLYTALITALYSAIPYKTPWCTLQLLVPLLVTVGLGYIVMQRAVMKLAIERGQNSTIVTRICALVFLVILPLLTIGREHVPGLVKINRNPDSAEIPYNYAHASPEAVKLAQCVADAVKQTKDKRPFIAVALPPADSWPFPWYNRKLELFTGYWTKFDELVELQKTGAKPAVVIVPMTEGHLVQPLFPHLKNTRRFYMRPGVRVRVFW